MSDELKALLEQSAQWFQGYQKAVGQAAGITNPVQAPDVPNPMVPQMSPADAAALRTSPITRSNVGQRLQSGWQGQQDPAEAYSRPLESFSVDDAPGKTQEEREYNFARFTDIYKKINAPVPPRKEPTATEALKQLIENTPYRPELDMPNDPMLLPEWSKRVKDWRQKTPEEKLAFVDERSRDYTGTPDFIKTIRGMQKAAAIGFQSGLPVTDMQEAIAKIPPWKRVDLLMAQETAPWLFKSLEFTGAAAPYILGGGLVKGALKKTGVFTALGKILPKARFVPVAGKTVETAFGTAGATAARGVGGAVRKTGLYAAEHGLPLGIYQATLGVTRGEEAQTILRDSLIAAGIGMLLPPLGKGGQWLRVKLPNKAGWAVYPLQGAVEGATIVAAAQAPQVISGEMSVGEYLSDVASGAIPGAFMRSSMAMIFNGMRKVKTRDGMYYEVWAEPPQTKLPRPGAGEHGSYDLPAMQAGPRSGGPSGPRGARFRGAMPPRPKSPEDIVNAREAKFAEETKVEDPRHPKGAEEAVDVIKGVFRNLKGWATVKNNPLLWQNKRGDQRVEITPNGMRRFKAETAPGGVPRWRETRIAASVIEQAQETYEHWLGKVRSSAPDEFEAGYRAGMWEKPQERKPIITPVPRAQTVKGTPIEGAPERVPPRLEAVHAKPGVPRGPTTDRSSLAAEADMIRTPTGESVRDFVEAQTSQGVPPSKTAKQLSEWDLGGELTPAGTPEGGKLRWMGRGADDPGRQAFGGERQALDMVNAVRDRRVAKGAPEGVTFSQGRWKVPPELGQEQLERVKQWAAGQLADPGAVRKGGKPTPFDQRRQGALKMLLQDVNRLKRFQPPVPGPEPGEPTEMDPDTPWLGDGTDFVPPEQQEPPMSSEEKHGWITEKVGTISKLGQRGTAPRIRQSASLKHIGVLAGPFRSKKAAWKEARRIRAKGERRPIRIVGEEPKGRRKTGDWWVGHAIPRYAKKAKPEQTPDVMRQEPGQVSGEKSEKTVGEPKVLTPSKGTPFTTAAETAPKDKKTEKVGAEKAAPGQKKGAKPKKKLVVKKKPAEEVAEAETKEAKALKKKQTKQAQEPRSQEQPTDEATVREASKAIAISEGRPSIPEKLDEVPLQPLAFRPKIGDGVRWVNPKSGEVKFGEVNGIAKGGIAELVQWRGHEMGPRSAPLASLHYADPDHLHRDKVRHAMNKAKKAKEIKTETIKVQTKDGEQEVEAWTYKQLAVHKTPDKIVKKGWVWAISEVASGRELLSMPNETDAKALAFRLGRYLDLKEGEGVSAAKQLAKNEPVLEAIRYKNAHGVWRGAGEEPYEAVKGKQLVKPGTVEWGIEWVTSYARDVPAQRKILDRMKRRGATDKEILDWFGKPYQAAHFTHYDTASVHVKPGPDPMLWTAAGKEVVPGSDPPPVDPLKGKALANRIREHLGIPKSRESKRQAQEVDFRLRTMKGDVIPPIQHGTMDPLQRRQLGMVHMPTLGEVGDRLGEIWDAIAKKGEVTWEVSKKTGRGLIMAGGRGLAENMPMRIRRWMASKPNRNRLMKSLFARQPNEEVIPDPETGAAFFWNAPLVGDIGYIRRKFGDPSDNIGEHITGPVDKATRNINLLRTAFSRAMYGKNRPFDRLEEMCGGRDNPAWEDSNRRIFDAVEYPLALKQFGRDHVEGWAQMVDLNPVEAAIADLLRKIYHAFRVKFARMYDVDVSQFGFNDYITHTFEQLPLKSSRGRWSRVARGLKGTLSVPRAAFFQNLLQRKWDPDYVRNAERALNVYIPGAIAKLEMDKAYEKLDVRVNGQIRTAKNSKAIYKAHDQGFIYSVGSTRAGLLAGPTTMLARFTEGGRRQPWAFFQWGGYDSDGNIRLHTAGEEVITIDPRRIDPAESPQMRAQFPRVEIAFRQGGLIQYLAAHNMPNRIAYLEKWLKDILAPSEWSRVEELSRLHTAILYNAHLSMGQIKPALTNCLQHMLTIGYVGLEPMLYAMDILALDGKNTKKKFGINLNRKMAISIVKRALGQDMSWGIMTESHADLEHKIEKMFLRPKGGILRNAHAISGLIWRFSEVGNRFFAVISGYIHARTQLNASHEQAIEYGRHVCKVTQGFYEKHNAPEFFRKGHGSYAVINAFMIYMRQYNRYPTIWSTLVGGRTREFWLYGQGAAGPQRVAGAPKAGQPPVKPDGIPSLPPPSHAVYENLPRPERQQAKAEWRTPPDRRTQRKANRYWDRFERYQKQTGETYEEGIRKMKHGMHPGRFLRMMAMTLTAIGVMRQFGWDWGTGVMFEVPLRLLKIYEDAKVYGGKAIWEGLFPAAFRWTYDLYRTLDAYGAGAANAVDNAWSWVGNNIVGPQWKKVIDALVLSEKVGPGHPRYREEAPVLQYGAEKLFNPGAIPKYQTTRGKQITKMLIPGRELATPARKRVIGAQKKAAREQSITRDNLELKFRNVVAYASRGDWEAARAELQEFSDLQESTGERMEWSELRRRLERDLYSGFVQKLTSGSKPTQAKSLLALLEEREEIPDLGTWEDVKWLAKNTYSGDRARFIPAHITKRIMELLRKQAPRGDPQLQGAR